MNHQLLKQLSDQKYALDQSAIVAATDVEGAITYVNDKFCAVSGYSREELMGQNHRVVNSGFHPPQFFKQLWETISSGRVWSGEICNRRKNREIYWVSTTIVPLIDDQGRVNQFLSIRFEITDLKNAEKTILEQNEKLVATSKLSAIGEMAAAITHEINNPLGVILGRVEMLKSMLLEKTLDRNELTRIADTIEVTGQRIERIVKSMRTMAHQQSDREPFERVMVSEIIEDAFNWCQSRFQNHGVQLRRPAEILKTRVECRSYQIVQVLVNLLNNSFDAVENLNEKWVELSLQENENDVEIRVTDSGFGIPEEVRKKIFDPFYSTKKVQYGSGLGLSISIGLIRQNKGELTYDSTQSRTTFCLRLKKKQDERVNLSS